MTDGICDTGSGACTLRAAIQEANAASDDDTITLPAGIFALSVPDAGDGSTDLDLMNPVTIIGAGPSVTVVDGQGSGRVFDVFASAVIAQLTIRGGDNETYGGGILAFPDTTLELMVRDAQLTANRATHGGAILVAGATVILERVSITGNTSSTSGAAIEIAFEFGGGNVTLRNSTVSGNTGQKEILNEDLMQLENVTLVDDALSSTGATTVAGTILDSGAGATVCTGTVASGGNNLEHGTSCSLAMPGDMSGVDPALGPLQDNGGGTLTHALVVTSPAVDAAGLCALDEDQRGKPRPLDGNSDASATCDIGAYEFDPADVPTSSTTSTTGTTSTTTTTLAAGCPTEATFAAVRCTVDALADRVGSAGTSGAFRDKIVAGIGKAGGRIATAEAASSSSAKKAKKSLKKAAALIKKARTKIGSKKGQKTFTDATERAALQSDADAARTAILSLMGSLG